MTRLRDTLVAAGLLTARTRQRSDSTHVLANIRPLPRLTLVAETMRLALNDLATAAPAWLRTPLAPAWAERYAVRVEAYRLPKDAQARQALVQAIGQDGFQLLTALHAPSIPPELHLRPAVQTLPAVWIQPYDGPHDVRWRLAADLPPHAQLIPSPYDLEARFATKREISWTGYKVHLTETCDEDAPHLIPQVETTPAPTNDVCMTEPIHTHLAQRARLPQEQLLDSGDVAAY